MYRLGGYNVKKIFVTLLTCILLLNLITIVPASAAVDNSKYVPKLVGTDDGAHLVFDPEVARIARRMSSDTYSISEKSKAENIAKTLKSEGFKDIQQCHHSDDALNDNFSNNFLVGAKTFEVDGKKKYIVAIAFRGTKLDGEFGDLYKDLATDIEFVDYNGFHKGFYVSAVNAYDTLCKMKFPSLKNNDGSTMTFKDYLQHCYDSLDYSILVTVNISPVKIFATAPPRL